MEADTKSVGTSLLSNDKQLGIQTVKSVYAYDVHVSIQFRSIKRETKLINQWRLIMCGPNHAWLWFQPNAQKGAPNTTSQEPCRPHEMKNHTTNAYPKIAAVMRVTSI